jgi:antitoxin PrlF
MPMLQSAITAKAQTTLPKGVREALGVRPGDRLAYVVEHDHAIIMKAEDELTDAGMAAFLKFLEDDIVARRSVVPLPDDLLQRANSLVGGVDVDIDAPIEGDVAI